MNRPTWYRIFSPGGQVRRWSGWLVMGQHQITNKTALLLVPEGSSSLDQAQVLNKMVFVVEEGENRVVYDPRWPRNHKWEGWLTSGNLRWMDKHPGWPNEVKLEIPGLKEGRIENAEDFPEM